MAIILGRKPGGSGGGGGAPSGPAGGDLSGTYPNPDIAAGAVGTTELANDAVDSSKIAANAVGTSEIATNAVGSDELADNAVDANAIANGVITAAKLASGLILLTELFDSTKGSDGATFDTGAGGFSTSLDHLILVMQLRTTEAVVLSSGVFTVNNDSAANYDSQVDRGRDTTASATDAQASATAFGVAVPGASAAAGVFGAQLVLIPNYALTTAEKSALSVGGFADEAAAGGDAGVRAFHWRNTAAISRIILTAGGGSNFLTGSRLTVYGIG